VWRCPPGRNYCTVLVRGACWSEEGLKALVYSAAHVGLDMQGPVRKRCLLEGRLSMLAPFGWIRKRIPAGHSIHLSIETHVIKCVKRHPWA